MTFVFHKFLFENILFCLCIQRTQIQEFLYKYIFIVSLKLKIH